MNQEFLLDNQGSKQGIYLNQQQIFQRTQHKRFDMEQVVFPHNNKHKKTERNRQIPCPIFEISKDIRQDLYPIFATAKAASIPACPPPTTITSKFIKSLFS